MFSLKPPPLRLGHHTRLQLQRPRYNSHRFLHVEESGTSVGTKLSATEISQLIDEHARQPPRPLTLCKLLSFARPLTAESVLESVEYVFSEIPRRLAMRVHSLEALPFIVGMNPFVARTLQQYRSSFQFLTMYPPVRTLQDNAEFVAQLQDFVQSHAYDIPTMAKGFQECARYMTQEQISNFLDGAITNRIAQRLIAEQHIALSRALAGQESTRSGHLGIVHMNCSPRDMIRTCGDFVHDLCEATLGASPEIRIDGAIDATFTYVPVHLEYILTEILKNAFRASVERHHKLHPSNISAPPIPPVVVTISPPPPRPSNAPDAHPLFLSMRIRDEGGGVSPTNMARIFSYSFTTAGRGAAGTDDSLDGPYAAQHIGGGAAMDGSMSGSGGGGLFAEMAGRSVQMGMGTIAGLGYGLPMSRLYAKYFGGSLDFVSLDGWGSDVFLKLRCLDDAGNSVL